MMLQKHTVLISRPSLAILAWRHMAMYRYASAMSSPSKGIPNSSQARLPISARSKSSSVLSARTSSRVRGVPLPDTPPRVAVPTPLADAPLTDTPLADAPLTDTPLTDTPLADALLADAPRCPWGWGTISPPLALVISMGRNWEQQEHKDLVRCSGVQWDANNCKSFACAKIHHSQKA